MAWLQGWEQRYKITIDRTKIDSVLTHFPVTVIIDSSGTDFWSVMTSNNYRKKVAFTKDDKKTQLYAECELFDATNKIAVYHVSGSDWTIDSDTDTTFYLYFDPNQSDNTTYIGDTGESPAQNVWDSNFKAVYHMIDATTSTIKDSTSNNNDGTKIAANEPIEADGKVAKAQYFDGSDYISVPENDVLDPTIITIEAWVKISSAPTNNGNIVEKGSNLGYRFRINNNQTVSWFDRGEVNYLTTTTMVSLNSWTYIVVMGDSSGLKIYLNGVLDKSGGSAYGSPNTSDPLYIGVCKLFREYFNGLIDEVRISSVARSADWIKATYHSTNNTLISSWSYEGPLSSVSRATFYSFNLAVSDILKKTSTPFDIKKYLIKPTNLIFDFLGPKEMAKIKAITKSIKTKFRVKKR